MKTRTSLQWVGHLTSAIFFLTVAVIPSGIYGWLWWLIPKTFWYISGIALLGVLWFTVQLIWGLYVAICWDGLHDGRPCLVDMY